MLINVMLTIRDMPSRLWKWKHNDSYIRWAEGLVKSLKIKKSSCDKRKQKDTSLKVRPFLLSSVF